MPTLHTLVAFALVSLGLAVISLWAVLVFKASSTNEIPLRHDPGLEIHVICMWFASEVFADRRHLCNTHQPSAHCFCMSDER